MMRVEELWFSHVVEEIPVPGGAPVILVALPGDRRRRSDDTVDLRVRVGGTEYLLQRFAKPYSAGRRGTGEEVLPWIEYGFVSNPTVRIILVGTVAVVSVSPTDGTVRPILRMFREEDRDTGFDRLSFLPVPDGFVLVYEGGAARIRFDGTVDWHRELFWNDILEGLEGEQLVFWSEYAEVGGEQFEGCFALRLADGSKIRLSDRRM